MAGERASESVCVCACALVQQTPRRVAVMPIKDTIKRHEAGVQVLERNEGRCQLFVWVMLFVCVLSLYEMRVQPTWQ